MAGEREPPLHRAARLRILSGWSCLVSPADATRAGVGVLCSTMGRDVTPARRSPDEGVAGRDASHRNSAAHGGRRAPSASPHPPRPSPLRTGRRRARHGCRRGRAARRRVRRRQRPRLVRLGAGEVGQALPPAFVWWRGFAGRYVAELCQHDTAAGGEAEMPEIPPPSEGELASLVLMAPMMAGAEYLTEADVLRALWEEIALACAAVPAASTSLQAFLKRAEPGLEPGRPRALQSGRKPSRS